MKLRTKWILGLSLGVPIVLIAGVLLALRLTSSHPELELSAIEVKDLPSTWAQDPPTVPTTPSHGNVPESMGISTAPHAQVSEPLIVPLIQAPAIENLGLPISGTLVMLSGDDPFGEESFELALEAEDVLLRSNGRFWFKALIATITLTYDQTLQMDSQLRPMSLASTFDAPLGFGRSIQAEFSNGEALVRSGKEVTTYAVDLDHAYVLGTFSTYAIIPLLYELREFEGSTTLETLIFGGPPTQDDASPKEGLPETVITKVDDSTIQFDNQRLVVSRYEISGDMGMMTLFARETEFLGITAGDDENSLFVYRADYFKNGFEVVQSIAP